MSANQSPGPGAAPSMFPSTVAEMAEAVRASPRAIAVGAGTKPRLAAVAPEITRISTTKLRGIVEYEPSEFTFTALAGTPVREIAATLAEKGQYLPFDPVLAEAGATLGGTVAAGLNGPGRWRFGGLRDFILGTRFVDGDGRVLRMGGKVVKNAAGFDLPKFFVGSAGRFGALAEITFKVFPRPPGRRTLRLQVADAAARARVMTACAAGRWELDALEAPVGETVVYARLAGPAAALDALAAEILAKFPGDVMLEPEATDLWRTVTEFGWAPADWTLAKVVLTPGRTPEFSAWVMDCAGARGWIGAGGNAGYIASPGGLPAGIPWPGVALRGAGALWLGPRRDFALHRAVKAALDPANRFPSLDN